MNKYIFYIGFATWQYETNNEGLAVRIGNSYEQIAWADIASAGIAPHQALQKIPVAAQQHLLLRGISDTVRAANLHEGSYDFLLIRCRKNCLLTLSLPIESREKILLIDDIYQHIGTRWKGLHQNLLQLRQHLGFTNWWIAPITFLVFSVYGFVFLLKNLFK